MNAKGLIAKKRDGGALGPDEISFLVRGAVDGTIPPYQLTAFLMAVYFQGLDREETTLLTEAMRDSGDRLEFPGSVDKHSTGGVGDKLSFLVAPLVAAAGVPVPMISGRSLGHTGGTLDKLESIPGVRTDLSPEEIRAQVQRLGVCIAAQGPRLAPADRLFYSLRDSASIVESIPLIVASILSKKSAAGVHALVLDVKVGEGAFMSGLARGRELARALVGVAGRLGMAARAYLTPMDRMLGATAGNALEIAESIRILRRESRPTDLEELTLELGAGMLELAGAATDRASGRSLISEAWDSGAGFERFSALVSAQGGERRLIDRPEDLPRSTRIEQVRSHRQGVFLGLRARPVGEWISGAGGGRLRADQPVDPTVGVEIVRAAGETVRAGDVVFNLHRPTAGGDGADAIAADEWILLEGDVPARSSWVDEVVEPERDTSTSA